MTLITTSKRKGRKKEGSRARRDRGKEERREEMGEGGRKEGKSHLNHPKSYYHSAELPLTFLLYLWGCSK